METKPVERWPLCAVIISSISAFSAAAKEKLSTERTVRDELRSLANEGSWFSEEILYQLSRHGCFDPYG